jgi:hypothetical protein
MINLWYSDNMAFYRKTAIQKSNTAFDIIPHTLPSLPTDMTWRNDYNDAANDF